MVKKCMKCGGTMKKGGSVKKMQAGGSAKTVSKKTPTKPVKKTLPPAPKPKTGMDALRALGKYVTTFGFATEGYNPAPSKKAKKTMKKGGPVKKMQTGGVPPPPSRSQYRSQIENKYKSKYYTKDNVYIGNPKRKKQVDILIEKQTNDSMRNRDNSIKNKKVPAKKIMAKGGSVGAGIPYRSGAGQTDGKNGMMQKGGAVKKPLKKTIIIDSKKPLKKTRIIDSKIPIKGPGTPVYKPLLAKKGGSVKKMAKGGSLKSVPASKVGLAKLPTAVRNKMGYKKTGGPVKKKK